MARSAQTHRAKRYSPKISEDDLVECIVALPKQLFYNTGIPACIWFLRREKSNHSKEVLFIDASEMGYMKDRVHRDLSDETLQKYATPITTGAKAKITKT